MTPLALEVNDLTIEYRQKDRVFRAVDRFHLSIPSGELFGLLGPNGAGKTSIISVIASIRSQFEGTVRVFGEVPGTSKAKRTVGLVPQELVSYGFFNVEEILSFNAGYFSIENAKERINWLLDRLQLTSSRHKKVAQLSGGMKRRLLIARALLHQPRLLLLDEPSAGVDVELREILWRFVRELHSQGTTILLTTHYLEEAEELCDRVAILHQGKLLALDSPKNLKASYQRRRIEIILLTPANVRSRLEGVDVLVDGLRIVAHAPMDMSLSDLLSQLGIAASNVRDVHTQEGDFELAFKLLIQGGKE